MPLSPYSAYDAGVEYLAGTPKPQRLVSGDPFVKVPATANLRAALTTVKKFSFVAMKEGVPHAGLVAKAFTPAGVLLTQETSAVDGAVTLVVDSITEIDILLERPEAPPEYNRMYRRSCLTVPYLVR